MATRRIRLSVIFSRERGQWQLKEGARVISGFASKRKAIDEGRLAGRSYWDAGRLAQLVVKGKNGRIMFENTYGKDPRRHKG